MSRSTDLRLDKEAVVYVRQNAYAEAISNGDIDYLKGCIGMKVENVLDRCSPHVGVLVEEYFAQKADKNSFQKGTALQEDGDNDFDFLVQQADELAKSCRYKEAVLLYEQALAFEPVDKELLISLLNCFFMEDDYGRAFFYAETLQNCFPDDKETQMFVLMIYTRIADDFVLHGKLDEADRLYHKVLVFDVDNRACLPAILGLGHVAYKRQDFEDAGQYYEWVLAIDARCVEAREAKRHLALLHEKTAQQSFVGSGLSIPPVYTDDVLSPEFKPWFSLKPSEVTTVPFSYGLFADKPGDDDDGSLN